jgi:hypothetical protein
VHEIGELAALDGQPVVPRLPGEHDALRCESHLRAFVGRDAAGIARFNPPHPTR